MVPRGAPPYRYNNQNPCLRSLCFLSISLPGFYRYDKEMARRPPRPTPRPLPPPLLLPVMPAASLYVGDLDPDVTESDLGDKFAPIAPLHSVRVCRSIVTGESLCYGYVNFWSPSDASKAMACLNHTDLKGKSMRIMWSQKDPSLRKSGVANLFVKNLDPSISSAHLHSIFGKFGTVLSCKVAEENGKSKGFGFVQFDKEEAAMAAQTALHDTMLEGKKLYVSNFVKKSERKAAAEANFTNLYVNNLIDNMTEDILKDIFSNFGEVSSVQIMKDDEGNSRGFGFVCFHSPDDAKNALANMNGVKLGSKTLFVGRAQKKAERTKMLKHAHRDMFNSHMERLKASNLYVKNLSKSIDDQKLKELFSSYGTITSARVMCNDNGMSKGFGFVSFSTPEEAKAALDELNGAVYGEGRLYVAIAQCKEDRLKEAQNNNQKLQNASTLPLYPSSSGITYARFQPLCFSLPTCPPPYAPVCQSFVSHLVGSVGFQHPFARKNYQQNFSSSVKIPMMHLGNSGDTGGWKYRQHSLTYGKSGIHAQDLNCSKSESLKVDLTKERTKKSGGAEGSTQILSSLTLPGNSKKNTGDLLGSQNSSA